MAKYERQLREEFLKFIADHGPKYSNWYIGISKNAEDTLFNKHKVDKKKKLWLWGTANDNNEAKMLVELMRLAGVDSDATSSDPKAVQVYIYKKAKDKNNFAKHIIPAVLYFFIFVFFVSVFFVRVENDLYPFFMKWSIIPLFILVIITDRYFPKVTNIRTRGIFKYFLFGGLALVLALFSAGFFSLANAYTGKKHKIEGIYLIENKEIHGKLGKEWRKSYILYLRNIKNNEQFWWEVSKSDYEEMKIGENAKLELYMGSLGFKFEYIKNINLLASIIFSYNRPAGEPPGRYSGNTGVI